MKNRILIAFLLILTMSLTNCSKDDNSSSSDCQTEPSKRRGAKCKDGTETTTTGSGACSGHGGVDSWLCK